MNAFNLSDWALRHRSFVWYFILAFALAGVFAYLGLGREEDPNFTIKTMVIAASWPGATVEDTMNQVTDRIEKKLEEVEQFDYARSLTKPGQATIFVNLKDTTRGKDVAVVWARIRNLIADIKGQLPAGVQGPTFNDDFGDVFGNVYAFTADGVTQRQLRDYAEGARAAILRVPNAGKVDLVGAQDEAIYLEFSTRQIAGLGIDRQAVIDALQAQNAVAPSGVVEGAGERVAVRVSGQFTSEESLRAINLRVNDRFFRLTDIATIRRGYVDPPTSLFRYDGQPAIGLAIGMKPNANLLDFGDALEKKMREIEAGLPIGVGVHKVADQPRIVRDAVGGFTEALFEAVAIVLAISFVSLGLRAGFVVSLTIPLVLAITFVAMQYLGISLQRISLGALIIALGLLVDDAMIAIEMMVSRLEAGDSREKAATAIYDSTAFPMLTGTLVTVAGFIPVGLNSSAAGEFTFTLFVVIAVSLVVSWVVAVLFAPLLGVTLMPAAMKGGHESRGALARGFEAVLGFCMRWRWTTIGVTLAAFALAIVGLGYVQQQFFPTSDRAEVIVDWTGRQNAAISDTREGMDRLEALALAGDPDVDHWTSYVGQGAVRFMLSFDVQPASPFFGQIVIVPKDLAARDRLRKKIDAIAAKQFPGIDVFVHLLDIGPPVGRPVQYRVSGPDIQGVRAQAQAFAAVLGSDPNVGLIVQDWNEPGRVVKVDVLQDKAAALGVTSASVAQALNDVTGGGVITQVRDSIYAIDVIGRGAQSDRTSIEALQNLQIQGKGGASVPLAAIARFRYELEQPAVWRRDRLPTITLKAAVTGDVQPATIVTRLTPKWREFTAALPPGYDVQVAGAVEQSSLSQGPIAAVAPLMLFIMATILMTQLQSFSRLFLVFAVAPLGLIGVVAALLPSRAPMGFVAILGILALIGILIRNSVILVIQIEHLRANGADAWSAVKEATQHRMRPILLTAAAASLALIPISRQIFWGPMAYAMMGGIIVGTVLTLLFLPALYLAWFRVPTPKAEAAAPPADA